MEKFLSTYTEIKKKHNNSSINIAVREQESSRGM